MGQCLSETDSSVRQPNHVQQSQYIQRSQPIQPVQESVRARSLSEKKNSLKSNSKKKQQKKQKQLKMKYIQPILIDQTIRTLIQPTSNQKFKNLIKPIQGQTIDLKVPIDYKLMTEFTWIKQQNYTIPIEVYKMNKNQIKNRSFQQKYAWFRGKLEQKRIGWNIEKSEILQVDRNNLLMSSKVAFENINFYKEVKIAFKNQKTVHDAGGLLRQWMSMCTNQIFSPQLGLFSLCQSSATYYKFNSNEYCQELFVAASHVLGTVIGKAIFQKIPLKCFLNYTILRQICNQPIYLSDFHTYDKDFHSGWSYMAHNNFITSLSQNFCVYQYDNEGNQKNFQLCPGGQQRSVTTNNRLQYISLAIQFYCTKSIEKMLQALRQNLNKIIPLYLFQIFEPYELDMIICGRKTIDIQDWRKNTQYTNYQPEDQVIQWLWEIIEKLPEQQLHNLLHYVTGTSRVPLLGFKYLESNRGQIQRFHIVKKQFDEQYPYPIGHTCFNRLELPQYKDPQTMKKFIDFISVKEINTFGLLE